MAVSTDKEDLWRGLKRAEEKKKKIEVNKHETVRAGLENRKERKKERHFQRAKNI